LRKTKRILRKGTKEYRSADTVNREGFPAWSKPDSELLYQFLYTNTLEPTFYASQSELVQEGVELLERFDDTEYMAETIVGARNEGFMRTAPIMGLVYLSKKDIGLFKQIFPSVVQTGTDMVQFLDLCRSVRGLGRGIKSTIHAWLREHANQFYAIKYGNELVDAIRLSRPSPNQFGKEQRIIIDYLMDNPEVNPSKLPEKIRAFERLKQTSDEKEILHLIDAGKLDYSVVVGTVKPTPRIWIKLAEQMGTFALLRHLATLERHGVLDELRGYIEERITVDALQKAKIFPFRVYEAYLAVHTQWVKEHLAEVLDQYVQRYDFSYFGRVAVCPDVSASMESRIRRAAYTPATIAGMFAGILYKGVEDALLVPWDTEVRTQLIQPKSAPVISHILAISNANGGGTYMEVPAQYLTEHREKVDVLILITDSEEWGAGWLRAWREYREQVSPEAKAFLIRVDPYNTNPFSPEIAERYNIHQIYGWSDTVIKYIEFTLKLDNQRIQ